MKYAISLLDKAAKLCGGYSALAEELDVALPNMSAVRHGKRELPEEWVPGIAAICGVDVHMALHEYRAEKFGRDHKKVKILEKKAFSGAVVMSLISYVLGSMLMLASPETGAAKLTKIYIVECLMRFWHATAHLLFRARGDRVGGHAPVPRTVSRHATPRRGHADIAALFSVWHSSPDASTVQVH